MLVALLGAAALTTSAAAIKLPPPGSGANDPAFGSTPVSNLKVGAPPAGTSGVAGSASGTNNVGAHGTTVHVGRQTGTTCTAGICTTFNNGLITKVCRTGGGKKSCTFYRASGAPYKTCVTKHGRTSCRTLRLRVASAAERDINARLNTATAFSAGLTAQGFLGQQQLPEVGTLISDYGPAANGGEHVGYCTATVIGLDLVLTASHCAVDTENGRKLQTFYFLPDSYYDANATDLAGNASPYGIWTATHYWVPPAFSAAGQIGTESGWDWGNDHTIIQFAPLNGHYLSQIVGTASATWNINYTGAAREYVVGYPKAGLWQRPDFFYGDSQYYCDTQYGGYYAAGSGYQIWAPCSMTAGSSGGPWFVLLSDGSWTIGGVTSFGIYWDGSRWQGCGQRGYCDYETAVYFGANFQALWHSVTGR